MPTNALIHEKSPYLRQHANNPVNWLPWGEEAFARARAEDKPIFLSIGYSTCHWCHVMAHESFEDEGVAEVLNRDFVAIKLDREERPDVDRIYMLFVQAATGSGGWPMSVWLTPDLKPFFGGTYYPPDGRYGRPGFRALLEHLASAWKNDRSQIEDSGNSVAGQLQNLNAGSAAAGNPDGELFGSAFPQFRRQFDSTWGGFGRAPKFPRPVVLNYLLRYHAAEANSEALEMVVKTLREMAKGGMHDQLGGGFHRYSVDEQWFVPHFEKMLYDQAQLANSYLEAYQASGDPALADTARDIFDYVLRDLRDEQGGFYSAEDADSPDPEHPSHSGEGAFYIWRHSEIAALLDPATLGLFERRFGVMPEGNVEHDPQGEFTGRNILYQALTVEEAARRSNLEAGEAAARLREAEHRLFAAREARPRPHLDNKILTSWNGLMISALARGYAVLGDEAYREAAERAARFLLAAMYDSSTGRLWRSFCDGSAGVEGFLDDYAFLAQALLDLFAVTFEAAYLRTAIELVNKACEHFEDQEAGGFFSTGVDTPDLLLRMKDDYDGAEPSGNSVFTDVLLRLFSLTGERRLEDKAVRALQAASAKLKLQPSMAPQMLGALGRLLAGPKHVVIRCGTPDPESWRLVKEEWKKFEPNTAVLLISDDSAQVAEVDSYFRTLERRGRITAYRCAHFRCELPEVIS